MILFKLSQARYEAILRVSGTMWSVETGTENPSEFTRLAASNVIRL